MRYYLLADNVCPPWNEGRKVVIRNYTQILSKMYGDSFKAILSIDRDNPSDKCECSNAKYLSRTRNGYLNTIRLCKQIIHENKNSKGIVHLTAVHHSLAVPLLRILRNKLKLVIHVFQTETDWLNQWRLKLNLRAAQFYSRFAEKICVTSPTIRKKLSDIGIESQYLPPAIDTEFFKPEGRGSPFVKKFKTWKGEVTLLYIGNIVPSRFLCNTVFRALNEVINKGINAKLLIFAPKLEYNYRYKRKLLKGADDFNVKENIHFVLRNLSEEEKRAVYNFADIFLFPALNPQAIDPPLTVLEAMSCGKIVITSPIQSIPSLIDHQHNGILADPSSGEYRSALFKVCNNFDAYREIEKNARMTLSENFSFSVVSQKLNKLHSELGR